MERSLSADDKLTHDQFTSRLTLIIGIAGLMIVFLLPDPLGILAPRLPLLMPQDWPGSRNSMRMFMTSLSPWDEMREFRYNIFIEDGVENSHIDQTVGWYSNPGEAQAFWDHIAASLEGKPLVAKSDDPGKPASRLLCANNLGDDGPFTCDYHARWERWYVVVAFWTQNEADLPVSEVQALAAKVNRHLQEAPVEPCFWFLCTLSK